MRTIVALKPCPQGQQPGEQFTVPDAHASALVLVGAATYADDDVSDVTDLRPPEARSRRRYLRRDLRADA